MSSVITPTLIQQHLLLASLDSGQTTLLTGIGDAVQSAIERETGRDFAATSWSEAYDGNDRDTLYLRHDPITAVASVTRNGTSVALAASSSPTWPPAACVWENDITRMGALRLTDGSVFTRGRRNIIVSYTAGWGTVPAALVRAGVIWSAYLFTNGRFPGTQEMKPDTLGDRPKAIDQLLAPFRRPWGAGV